jgi:hypothetical protein
LNSVYVPLEFAPEPHCNYLCRYGARWRWGEAAVIEHVRFVTTCLREPDGSCWLMSRSVVLPVQAFSLTTIPLYLLFFSLSFRYKVHLLRILTLLCYFRTWKMLIQIVHFLTFLQLRPSFPLSIPLSSFSFVKQAHNTNLSCSNL